MNSIRIIVFGTLLGLFSLSGNGQNRNISPYSVYGIGLVQKPTNIAQKNSGGIGYAYIPNRGVNVTNPAFNGFLQNTYFDLGLAFLSQRITEQGITGTNQNAIFTHAQLFFPIKRDKWGLSFGLQPYSKTGYFSVGEKEVNQAITTSTLWGQGGINDFNVSLARKIKIDSSLTISLGAKGHFLFGEIEKNKKVEVALPDVLNYYERSERYSKGSGYEIGLIATKQLNDHVQVGLGATYIGSIALKSDYLFLGTSYQSNITGTIDTILSSETTTTSNIPNKIGFGAFIKFNDNFMFNVDYDYQNWSSFNFPGNFTKQTELNVGGQFFIARDKNDELEKVILSIGATQKQHYFLIEGLPLICRSASLGIGIPVSSKIKYNKSKSIITFGTEIGQYNNTHTDLTYNERFINVYLGISLSPSVTNTWFRKRKYD